MTDTNADPADSLRLPFSGTTALITGAASGIGAVLADVLAEQGLAQLVLVDRDEDQLTDRAEALRARGVAVLDAAMDVADPEAWERLAADAEAVFGSIDYAVANAGIAGNDPIETTSFDQWRQVMSVNVDGVFLTLKTAVASMRAHDARGSIVVVASTAGLSPLSLLCSYSVSKAAAAALARVVARDAGRDGIRVNAILPGGVQTPIWMNVPAFARRAEQSSTEQAFEEFEAARDGLGTHFEDPRTIAEQIAFLLSDSARNITGTGLVSDGGFTL